MLTRLTSWKIIFSKNSERLWIFAFTDPLTRKVIVMCIVCGGFVGKTKEMLVPVLVLVLQNFSATMALLSLKLDRAYNVESKLYVLKKENVVKMFCCKGNKLRKLNYRTWNVFLYAGQVALLKKWRTNEDGRREEEIETEYGIRERKKENKSNHKIKEILMKWYIVLKVGQNKCFQNFGNRLFEMPKWRLDDNFRQIFGVWVLRMWYGWWG